MSPRWKVCQAIPCKQMTLGLSASPGPFLVFLFQPAFIANSLPHSCFPFSSGFLTALHCLLSICEGLRQKTQVMGRSETGSGEAAVDFTGISTPGYEQMSRTVREVAKQLGGHGVRGYYGTHIQSYKHTLLSSSGPICMAVNSAAGLGIWVPATPGSLCFASCKNYQAACITALPG